MDQRSSPTRATGPLRYAASACGDAVSAAGLQQPARLALLEPSFIKRYKPAEGRECASLTGPPSARPRGRWSCSSTARVADAPTPRCDPTFQLPEYSRPPTAETSDLLLLLPAYHLLPRTPCLLRPVCRSCLTLLRRARRYTITSTSSLRYALATSPSPPHPSCTRPTYLRASNVGPPAPLLN